MKHSHVAVAFALSCAAAASCQLISGASDTKFVPTTGAGAMSGAGGHGGAGGQSAGCTKASDCPGVDTGCTPRACQDGKCGTMNAPKNAACSDDKGKVCDDTGKCVGCNSDDQCTALQYCSTETHACRPKACQNNVKDGFETGLDCGGKECDPCANGKGCITAPDCKSGFCKPIELSGAGGGGGASASGSGGAASASSTGGAGGAASSSSSGGAGGAASSSGSGGAGGAGTEATGVCLPCTNDGECSGIANSYCVKGICVPQKKLADACGAASECLSGFCADKLCCNSACSGECSSCIGADTGGKNGTCGAVTAKTDPAGECNLPPQSTCGAKGSGCNGNAAKPHCIDWDSGTECIAQVCKDAEHVTPPGTCDGDGTCKPATTADCQGYQCQAKACLASCSGDGECAATHYCDAKTCLAKKKNGDSCGATNQCISGFCADGVCCDSACDGACAACATAKGADVDGTCKAAAVKSALDPGACDAANGCANKGCGCDAAGTCKSLDGASCSNGGTCLSGFCADGVCCNTACTGACSACSKVKGADVDGSCKAAAVKNGVDTGACDKDNGTCATKPCSCDNAGACKNALGVTCAAAAQCASGFCPPMDGVCCDKACTATCEACVMSKFTGKPDGTCNFIMAGKDPDNECVGILNCNGAGACF